MSDLLTLKEVCKEVGVTRRNVQGYEQKGLVSPTTTNKYGHLLYDLDTCERIKQIKLYQQLGFSLRKIKDIIDLPNAELKHELEKQLKILKDKVKAYDELIIRAQEIIEER